MSIVFLFRFLQLNADAIPGASLTYDFLMTWALFAIADALWVRALIHKEV